MGHLFTHRACSRHVCLYRLYRIVCLYHQIAYARGRAGVNVRLRLCVFCVRARASLALTRVISSSILACSETISPTSTAPRSATDPTCPAAAGPARARRRGVDGWFIAGDVCVCVCVRARARARKTIDPRRETNERQISQGKGNRRARGAHIEGVPERPRARTGASVPRPSLEQDTEGGVGGRALPWSRTPTKGLPECLIGVNPN